MTAAERQAAWQAQVDAVDAEYDRIVAAGHLPIWPSDAFELGDASLKRADCIGCRLSELHRELHNGPRPRAPRPLVALATEIGLRLLDGVEQLLLGRRVLTHLELPVSRDGEHRVGPSPAQGSASSAGDDTADGRS